MTTGEQLRIVFITLVFVALGYVMSQYSPFLGGDLVSIAEPFSPIRKQHAMAHVTITGLAGLLIALVIVLATRKPSANSRR